MSKLPTAGRFSLVNELQDSFSSHTVLYGHAGHKPMDDGELALSESNGVDVRRPDSDEEIFGEVTSARGLSPGGRAFEPMTSSAMVPPDANTGGEDLNPIITTPPEPQQPDSNGGLNISYTGNQTSLDESAGLQNAELGTTARDRDDHDTHIDAVPATFGARLVEMGLGDPAHAALSGFDGFSGGNAFEFDSDASTIFMALVDGDGEAFNGADSGLRTVIGESIYLYSDTHNPAIVFGTTDLGDVVFAVYLEHTENSVQGGALWSVLYQPLEHPDPMDTDEAVDLSGLVFAQVSTANGQDLHEIPSGNHLFFMVGNASSGYVVTGKEAADQSAGQQINKGDTVNVSQANGTSSLGVNNQMIDPEGEGLFITFVNDPSPSYTGSELSQTEADREANIQFGSLRSANSAYFKISQTQPAVRDATVEVAAWQTNAGVGADFISSSVVNTLVAIDRVRVLDSQLNVLEDSTGLVDSAGISIEIVDGIATVTGIKVGYWIEYQTVEVHNRMSISNPDAGKANKAAAFDVGGFSTGVIATQTVEVGQLLQFEDDAPVMGPPMTDYINSEMVDVGGEQQMVMRQSGFLNFDYGADGGDGFRWVETGAPAGFAYLVTGNVLDVYQGDKHLMSVEFDPITGQYQATQHMLAQGPANTSIQFPLLYEIVDRDGDAAVGQLNLVPELQILTSEPPRLDINGNRVALDESSGLQNLASSLAPGDQDDNDIAPSSLPINMIDRLQAIGAGTPTFSALSGYDGAAGKPLANLTGDLSALTSLAFSDAMGMALDGDDSGLFTLDGEPIYLYTDTLDPALLLGKTAEGDVVLAAYLEIQGGSEPGVMMWTALYEPLQHPDPMDADEAVDLTDRVFIKTGSETTYDLSDVKPGQFLFFTTGDATAALVFTGKHPANQSEGELVNSGDTVNPSAATTTTVGTNNQMIDPPTYDKFGEVVKPAEGVVVSFVTGANPAYTGVNLSPGEAVVEANIQFSGMIDAFQASFIVSQLQPVKSATVEVSAWHTAAEPGTEFIDGLLVDDTPINVTRVTVYDENGLVLEDSDGSVESSDIEITILGGVANIAGVNPGYQIEYYTDQAHNRVLIENAGSRNENLDASFDLGAFTLVQTSATVTEIGSAMVFEDDGVTVSPNDTVFLDDDALAGGNAGGIGDQDPDVVAATGTLGHSFAADQPGSIAWLTDGAPAGFSYEAYGSDLLVKQGATTVMTLTLDAATGAYAVMQNAAIEHEPGMDENDATFRVGYRVTDADGDSVDGSIAIEVDDDTPVVSENATVYLDDDALVGGNAGGIGDQDPDVVAAAGTLGHSFGADQPGSIAWLTDGAPAGFTYEASGTDLLVKQGATTVMTLSLDSTTGAYSVVQNAAVMHESGIDENDQSFTVAYRVTDADGDSTDGSLSISVDDDTPVVSENATVYLDDDALAGGNAGGIGDQDPDVVAATGTLGHSFGADQPGSIAWLTDGAPAGFSYEASGSDLLVKQGAVTVLTLSLDSATGAYTVMQNAAIMHEPGMDENDQAFTVGYRVNDADGDAADGILSLVVNDDTPSVSANATVLLDDDGLSGGNPGGIDDQDPDAVGATGVLGHSFGADQPGSIAWLTAGAPAGFTYEASGTDLLVKQGAVTVLTLSLDASTGTYAVVQNAPVQHETAFDENDQAFEVSYRVSDADGDSVDGSLSIVVNDDTPVVNEVTGVTYFNTQNPAPGVSGVFDYSVGADSRSDYSATNTDLLMFRLTGTVGVNSITNSSITWVSESDEAALFRVGFDYQPSESSVEISTAGGYIEFDKVQGTYQFWLDEPLQGFSISTTSSALGFTGYEVNSEVTDKTQPAVMVAQMNDGLYAQFTGYNEPGGGTGSNNLQALGVDADSSMFVNGEQFVQAASYVSVSNVANGVGGDTLQKGEVLNFTLHNTNPYGYLDQPASEYADSMFLKFDGIGSTEDLVVVLSLIDPDTMAETTRALIVDSADILKIGNPITPAYRIVLDNNDGAVIIESNDFNAPGESYMITGVQVLVSVEGVAGEGIEFNSLIGDEGASTTTRAFGVSDTDSDVIKISDIGVMTQSSSTLSAELQIDLAVIDTDFDASVTQAIDISILGSVMASVDTTV